jgi:hypothetical protein
MKRPKQLRFLATRFKTESSIPVAGNAFHLIIQMFVRDTPQCDASEWQILQ